jgi:hypothetical protein
MARDEEISLSHVGIPWKIDERTFGRKAIYRGGALGVLGFAGGWAVTQAITGATMPDDPSKDIIDVAGGLILGASLFVLAAAGVINITPLRIKF